MDGVTTGEVGVNLTDVILDVLGAGCFLITTVRLKTCGGIAVSFYQGLPCLSLHFLQMSK